MITDEAKEAEITRFALHVKCISQAKDNGSSNTISFEFVEVTDL